MSYITYSPTSLESFLIRGTIYNNNVYYTKLKLKPGSVSIFGIINNAEIDVLLVLDKAVFHQF